MKVLVACEFSGVVRDAFLARGHDAWSCDILPTEVDGPHIQGDALVAIECSAWDLIIAHPPCTYLANSGVQHLHTDPTRFEKLAKGFHFFMACWTARTPRLCVENPIPHKSACLPPYQQKIQPYEFGHKAMKSTCLWLRGLPPLMCTALMADRGEKYIDKNGKSNGSVWYQLAKGNKGHERSRTFPGIAKAMAEQWG